LDVKIYHDRLTKKKDIYWVMKVSIKLFSDFKKYSLHLDVPKILHCV